MKRCNLPEYEYIRDLDCTKDTPVIYGISKKPIYGLKKCVRPQIPGRTDTAYTRSIYLDSLLPIEEYDTIIVLFSGGKDSTACYYTLLELGVPKSKIELWHHDIDGGNPLRRMDWRCTNSYVKAFAKAEQVTLRISYRVNGFFGELYRVGASEPIEYIDPESGTINQCRLSPKYKECRPLKEKATQDLGNYLQDEGHSPERYSGKKTLSREWLSVYMTYRSLKLKKEASASDEQEPLKKMENEFGISEKFPAKGSIRNGRWCSALLKQDAADSLIRHLHSLELYLAEGVRHKFPAKGSTHQGRWCSGSLKASVQDTVTSNLKVTKQDAKVLIVSGERRGESPGRAGYNEIEKHRTNAEKKAHRIVHVWRAVIDYSEKDSWEVSKRHHANPHPCYRAGWNRCSCAMCVFSLPKHFAGIKELYPEDYEMLKRDEKILQFTIDSKKDLDTYIGNAGSCVYHGDQKAIHSLISGEFSKEDIYITPWRYPAGAFHGAEGGPC